MWCGGESVKCLRNLECFLILIVCWVGDNGWLIKLIVDGSCGVLCVWDFFVMFVFWCGICMICWWEFGVKYWIGRIELWCLVDDCFDFIFVWVFVLDGDGVWWVIWRWVLDVVVLWICLCFVFCVLWLFSEEDVGCCWWR